MYNKLEEGLWATCHAVYQGKGKVPVLNKVPCREDILCLIKDHTMERYGEWRYSTMCS